MTGAALGLVLGLGLLSVWRCWWPEPPGLPESSEPSRPGSLPRRLGQRVADELTQAGVDQVTPRGLLATCAGASTVVGLAVGVATGVPAIGGCFGVMAGWAPLALVRARARRRRSVLREAWPEAVDNVASAVRAGLSLPEALSQLAERGPEELRPAFRRFAEDYRASGRFAESLDRLKLRLADPVADRLVEAFRLAREVGGTDLGRLLRTLSAFLREDARTRGELETRQGWTVNGARVAVAAPWVVLAMLSTRPQAVVAYGSAAGALVLAIGAVTSVVAYRIMIRVGRLPEEQRVLR